LIVPDDDRWIEWPGPGACRDYEWDQSDDPYMINKTIRCPIPRMSGLFCLASHVDGWGYVHQCERNVGHTGRHFSCNWKHDYIVAVWR
jgi:hypothetical protein